LLSGFALAVKRTAEDSKGGSLPDSGSFYIYAYVEAEQDVTFCNYSAWVHSHSGSYATPSPPWGWDGTSFHTQKYGWTKTTLTFNGNAITNVFVDLPELPDEPPCPE
jgi:hypothetical protein